jgi:hypothetical protein
MGFAISLVAVRDGKENTLLDLFGLEKTGETEEIPEREWSTPRIGDWTVVWSNRFQPKKFRDAGSKLKGEVIICDVEEHVMYASVTAFKDSSLSWRIVHDAQQASDHLSVEGVPPKSLPKIQTEQFARVSEDREVDFIFEIPIRVAQELVGFRHDEAVERTFEVLRPAAGSKSKWKVW